MPTMQATGKNQQGASETYTGVALNELLKQAGVQASATTLLFAGDGGQTAEAASSAVQACADCMLSFRTRGGFSLVMPGFADRPVERRNCDHREIGAGFPVLGAGAFRRSNVPQ